MRPMCPKWSFNWNNKFRSACKKSRASRVIYIFWMCSFVNYYAHAAHHSRSRAGKLNFTILFPLFCWAHSFKTQAAKIITTQRANLFYSYPESCCGKAKSEKRGDATRRAARWNSTLWPGHLCLLFASLTIMHSLSHLHGRNLFIFSYIFNLFALFWPPFVNFAQPRCLSAFIKSMRTKLKCLFASFSFDIKTRGEGERCN